MTEKDCYTIVQRKFIQINRLHRTIMDKIISATGLHRSQHMLLVHLSHTQSAPTQKEIADAFQISSAAVAVTLKKMEQNGYISRISPNGDMRCNKITITEKGYEILKATKKIVDGIDAAIYAGFTKEELATFSACLDKMQENLLNL